MPSILYLAQLSISHCLLLSSCSMVVTYYCMWQLCDKEVFIKCECIQLHILRMNTQLESFPIPNTITVLKEVCVFVCLFHKGRTSLEGTARGSQVTWPLIYKCFQFLTHQHTHPLSNLLTHKHTLEILTPPFLSELCVFCDLLLGSNNGNRVSGSRSMTLTVRMSTPVDQSVAEDFKHP